MNSTQARQLIEAVITMSTPEMAAQHVQTNLQLLLDPTCFQVISEMLRDEQQNEGVTKRYRALTRLNEYTSALIRNQLINGISGGEAAEELPELMVVTPENASEEYDIEEEEYDFKPDSFDSWWRILNPNQPGNTAAGRVEESEPLGDLAISNLLHSIGNRLLSASVNLAHKRANTETILECTEVLRDCHRLLSQAQPTYYRVDTLAVRSKESDALRYIARAYDAQGNSEQAKLFFQRAADSFIKINKKNEADRCLADIAWVELSHEGDVNAAVTRLHGILETVPENTLEHAEFLLELAQMHSAADDDYEAEQIALNVQKKLGYLNPTGAQLADALTESLMAVFSDQSDASNAPILKQNQIRSLYRGLYMLLEKIYRKRGDLKTADKYMGLLKEMDGTINQGNKLNLEFTDRMSSQFDSVLEQFNKYLKGDQKR